MKYFKIDFKTYYDVGRVPSYANGEEIPNAESIFNSMRDGQIITEYPIFDYFFLESYDEKKYWEWKLCDVYKFTRNAGLLKGWLISQKLKLLFDNFNFPQPLHYYPSKLLYKGKKLDYYIFQFYGKLIYEQTLSYINYSRTLFWNPVKKEDVIIMSKEDFLPTYIKIYDENGSLDNAMQNKFLVLKENLDFFPMVNFLKDNIASERLKTAIEENGIEGFEFSELDYEVVVNE